MRNNLAILFFLFFSSICSSQNDTIVNFLNEKKNAYVPKDKAFFTQVIITNPDSWSMILYNKKGELLSDEQFSDYNLTKMFGEQKYYHSNGKLDLLKTFNKDGNLEGKFVRLFEGGTKKMVGSYKNGEREGVWYHYYENGNRLAKITYYQGKVVRHKLWNEEGQEKDEPLIFERRAQFVGGEKAWSKYVKKNLLPKFKRSKFRGKLIVTFSIDIDGRAVDIDTRPKNLSQRDSESIIDFFNEMPSWKPALQLNRPVKMKFTLPLKLD